jgi:hypothetical protein
MNNYLIVRVVSIKYIVVVVIQCVCSLILKVKLPATLTNSKELARSLLHKVEHAMAQMLQLHLFPAC